MQRYEKILNLIDIFQPKTLCEIGVWNGDNAIRMINAASKYNEVSYIGYDLFEDGSAEIDKSEFNVKPNFSRDDVMSHILQKCPTDKISLVKGNTRETLRELCVDFAFIDGGHSLETIGHDYECLKSSSVIVFDDYYLPDHQGFMPDINEFGCNRIVDKLPHAIIDTQDPIVGGGFVALAVVFGAA